MSFKEVQLPGILLADLFKADIIITNDTAHQQKKITEPQQPQAVKKHLGDNWKNVCVLVNDTDNIFIDDESLAFLTSVLGACKLTIADVAIVNNAHANINVTELNEWLKPAFCLMFGVTTQQINLPFTIPLYQVQNFNGCKYVTAPASQVFIYKDEQAIAEKRKLWTSLKNMFNI